MPEDVPQSQRQHRLNRKVIIGHARGLAEVDIVIVNAAHSDFDSILKTARLGRNLVPQVGCRIQIGIDRWIERWRT